MPCRDYESDDYAGRITSDVSMLLKRQADRLARIASTVMKAYEAGMPIAELLKDKEVADWWEEHKKADAKEALKIVKDKEKKLALAKAKKDAASKLTDEELAAFGLHKNGNKK